VCQKARARHQASLFGPGRATHSTDAADEDGVSDESKEDCLERRLRGREILIPRSPPLIDRLGLLGLRLTHID
jgi:hypothetical protein